MTRRDFFANLALTLIIAAVMLGVAFSVLIVGWVLGSQQTAQIMEDDILTEKIPIVDSPTWGRIDKPGLGVEVDQDKLMRYHEAYRKHGEFPTYAGKLAQHAT